MSREAFGPNLRRIRMHRQIPLEEIARDTKIPLALLEGLERNDLAEWPARLFARAYVRQYAIALGVDPDATVDEFCRWFPEGDRRAERLVREHAELIGHELEWKDERPAGETDRRDAATVERQSAARPSPVSALFIRVMRGFHKV